MYNVAFVSEALVRKEKIQAACEFVLYIGKGIFRIYLHSC